MSSMLPPVGGVSQVRVVEPLQALAKFRFDRELKGVIFGQNLILIEGAGAQLRVGQELTPAPGRLDPAI